jgi:CubicO group peptidase (beta-lactamase class C family)
MTIVIDDPASPMAWYLSAALGYLLGLGFIGYAAVLTFIKARVDRAGWPRWLASAVIGLHFALGIGAMTLAPATLLHRLKLQGAMSTEGGIAFFIAIVSVLGIGIWVAGGWNRPLDEAPSNNRWRGP